MRVAPESIQIVVFDGRGVVPELAHWLSHESGVWYASALGIDRTRPIYEQRNAVAARFLAESDKGYLLMIDDDQVPDEQCVETLHCEAPVVGARYWSRWGGHCHGDGPGEVGMGFVKIARHVLATVGDAPFTPGADECECRAFCRRCRDVGFLPIHVGAVGHYTYVIVKPTADGSYLVRGPDKPGTKSH